MQQNKTLETIATSCNTISDFLAHRDLPSLTKEAFGEASGQAKADLIILLGNAVLEALNVTAKAYKQGLARKLMVAGGLGHSTSYLADAVTRENRPSSVKIKDRAEAEILGDLLVEWHGVDSREIIIEKESTNCGDNAIKSLRQTQEYGLNPHHVILIQDPTMQLRSHASFQKVWWQKTDVTFYSYAAFVPKVVVDDGQLALKSTGGQAAWDIERFISLLLGEIPRLRDDRNGYGPAGKNFIVHIDIPDNVHAAYKKLRHWVEANRPSVARRLF